MSQSSCHELARCLSAYVDGELEASQIVAIEDHADVCAACASRIAFAKACRSSVRNEVKSGHVPDAMRMRAAIAVAQAREDSAQNDTMVGPNKLLSLRIAGPIAAAAAFALVWAAVARMPSRTAGLPLDAPGAATAAAMLSIDSFLEDLVEQHANPLPPETTNPSDVESFDKFIGVPVHTVSAPTVPAFHGRWLGGRMMPMREQRAAMLQYQLDNGRRITVYVYNPGRIRVAASPRLRAEVVGNAPMYVGYVRGYSVAVTDKRGVGYALASDLDEQENSKLLVAVGSAP